MAKDELSDCYEQGFAKQGSGAIIITSADVWHYEPLSKLHRFRNQVIEPPVARIRVQYKSRNFLDLVNEVNSEFPGYFVAARFIYHPFRPFGRQLFASVRER